jgi:hypothetical protein
MKHLGPFLIAMTFALNACSSTTPGTIPSGATGASGAAVHSDAVAPNTRHRKSGRIAFHIVMPRLRQHGRHHAHYIPASGQSITITLNTVNGAPPQTGIATSTNSTLTGCATGCTVVGPFSPPGSDNFTVTIFAGPVGAPGAALSTATKTFTLAVGTQNNLPLTLDGVPAKFALHASAPVAAGGTPLVATALPIDVLDAAGDVITGTYSSPVTITDPDTSSLTACSGLCGSALQLGAAGTAVTSVVLTDDTDAGSVEVSYGGLDIAPAVLTGSTSAGALTASGAVSFAPSVAAISYTGPTLSMLPELDLYAPSGHTGSTGAFTDAQAGWTNTPYNQTITEGDTCSTIATFAQTTGTNGTAWTATAIAAPVAGTCTATLTGGGAATLAVTTTYTSGTIGVNARHHSH